MNTFRWQPIKGWVLTPTQRTFSWLTLFKAFNSSSNFAIPTREERRRKPLSSDNWAELVKPALAWSANPPSSPRLQPPPPQHALNSHTRSSWIQDAHSLNKRFTTDRKNIEPDESESSDKILIKIDYLAARWKGWSPNHSVYVP